jgi:hypothetical protein
MTITDPRQPVFIKKGKRYVAVGSLDDFARFDAWHSPGLWLHTRLDNSTRMTKIADLEDMPCTAVKFASVMSKAEELMNLLHEHRNESRFDLAAVILEWIAGQSTPTKTKNNQ